MANAIARRTCGSPRWPWVTFGHSIGIEVETKNGSLSYQALTPFFSWMRGMNDADVSMLPCCRPTLKWSFDL
jgi:hypothetical protein